MLKNVCHLSPGMPNRRACVFIARSPGVNINKHDVRHQEPVHQPRAHRGRDPRDDRPSRGPREAGVWLQAFLRRARGFVPRRHCFR